MSGMIWQVNLYKFIEFIIKLIFFIIVKDFYEEIKMLH
jgi:hypothetical protein